MNKSSILLSCCLCFFVQVVNAESERVRLSFENVPVSVTEDMGTRVALCNTMDLSIDVGRMQGMDGGTFAANVPNW